MITPQKRARYIAPDGSLTQEGILFFLSIFDDVAALKGLAMTKTYAANVQASGVTATGYTLLVDISDTTNYRHSIVGALSFSRLDLAVDKTGTSQGVLQVGVIGAIDGTEATIYYSQGFSFEKTDENSIQRDRAFAMPFRMAVVGGKPKYFQTEFEEVTTAVNTSSTITTGAGTTVTPEVGDIIVKYTHLAGGAYNAAASCQYTMEVTP